MCRNLRQLVLLIGRHLMSTKRNPQTTVGTHTPTRYWTADGEYSSLIGGCGDGLTGVHHHGHGGLLDDGSYLGEGGEAAVVRPAVVLHGVSEVQVPVQVHGHPLVLIDLLQAWGRGRGHFNISYAAHSPEYS